MRPTAFGEVVAHDDEIGGPECQQSIDVDSPETEQIVQCHSNIGCVLQQDGLCRTESFEIDDIARNAYFVEPERTSVEFDAPACRADSVSDDP